MVPRCEEYLFNEELINYGQNKITYVETLRLNGIFIELEIIGRIQVCYS